jgi:hypothetical protein
MRLFSILFFSLFFTTFIFGQTIDISHSEIKEVKVFFQGAEIVRKFKQTVPSGKTELRILNLSSDLDASSIVKNGLGNAVNEIKKYFCRQ